MLLSGMKKNEIYLNFAPTKRVEGRIVFLDAVNAYQGLSDLPKMQEAYVDNHYTVKILKIACNLHDARKRKLGFDLKGAILDEFSFNIANIK